MLLPSSSDCIFTSGNLTSFTATKLFLKMKRFCRQQAHGCTAVAHSRGEHSLPKEYGRIPESCTGGMEPLQENDRSENLIFASPFLPIPGSFKDKCKDSKMRITLTHQFVTSSIQIFHTSKYPFLPENFQIYAGSSACTEGKNTGCFPSYSSISQQQKHPNLISHILDKSLQSPTQSCYSFWFQETRYPSLIPTSCLHFSLYLDSPKHLRKHTPIPAEKQQINFPY